MSSNQVNLKIAFKSIYNILSILQKNIWEQFIAFGRMDTSSIAIWENTAYQNSHLYYLLFVYDKYFKRTVNNLTTLHKHMHSSLPLLMSFWEFWFVENVPPRKT